MNDTFFFALSSVVIHCGGFVFSTFSDLHYLCIRCCAGLSTCSQLLLRQGEWSQGYAPAVEQACAATVVESSPEAITSGSRSNTPLPRRKRILTLLTHVDTEEQLSKLQLLIVQGRWLEWTDVMNSDLPWRRLIHGIDDGELSFTLRAITYTLPTPDNLRRGGQQTTDPACPLCGRHATPRHIWNGCSIALRQGRYTWRHDNVLRILKRHLTDFWEALQRENNHPPANLPFIHVVREGCPQLPNRNQSRRPLFNNDTLRCASDWKILFNIDGGYQISLWR